MKPLAIVLVVVSALLHSLWNLLLKKGENKLVFNWYMLLSASVLYLPFFLYFVFTEKIVNLGWLFIIFSAIFHTFYFYFLGQSYQKGYLSLTYPISRSSPLFVPFIAFFLIKEKLSIVGIVGIITVLIGIYLLHLRSFALASFFEPFEYMKEKATIYAFMTALLSAFYSVNDKIGVRFVPPFIFIYLTTVFSFIFYIPVILHKKYRNALKKEWTSNRFSILLSGLLLIFSYILILFAFIIDKVSYIVSLRELSIIIGVILGIFLLKEKYGKPKLIASAVMFIGFILVAAA